MHGDQKNGIGSKKFMQVEGYVKCIQANFGGHGLTIFGDIATLMFGQISLLDHD